MRWIVVGLLCLAAFAVPAQGQLGAQCDPQTDLIVLEATVDNPTPYIGEQIIYTMSVYNTTQSAPTLELPAFESFWLAGALDAQKREQPDCSGITVGVTVNERVLFPLRAGQQTIQPGTLDFSQNPVFEATTRVVSNETRIDVQPLPDGAPATFSGAVGYPLFVDARLGRVRALAGDPISLQVTVEGAGNLELVTAPDLPLPASWRQYLQPTRLDTAVESRLLVGRKVFEWLIIPDEIGIAEIPPIEFTYFDINSAIYRTIETAPLAVEIAPATDARAVEPAPVDLTANALPIKSSIGRRAPASLPVLWLLWSLPPLVFIGVLSWRWRSGFLQRESVRIRRSQALRQARSRLARIQRHQEDAQRNLRLAILSYFADRWNMPVGAVDEATMQQGMVTHGVALETMRQLMDCLRQAEQERYAPATAPLSRDLIQQTLRSLLAVDAELERKSA